MQRKLKSITPGNRQRIRTNILDSLLSYEELSVFSSNIKQQKQTNDDSKNNNDNG